MENFTKENIINVSVSALAFFNIKTEKERESFQQGHVRKVFVYREFSEKPHGMKEKNIEIFPFQEIYVDGVLTISRKRRQAVWTKNTQSFSFLSARCSDVFSGRK